MAYLQTHPAPDLIFMDIELADGQSFEIFEQTTVSAPVIFTTSYDEYAIKVNSIDYPLDELESMLDPALFFGANRQALVQINAVPQIHPYFNNKLKLTL